MADFVVIPKEQKYMRAERRYKAPSGSLSHQLSWTNLLIEREEQADRELERPALLKESLALEYKWKDLGDIYLSFCGRTREYRGWMSRARGCRK